MPTRTRQSPPAAPGDTDTVPAMLTPGEYVMKRDAVKRIGVDKLNRLNNGYANGGVVDTAPHAQWVGGVAPRAQPVTPAAVTTGPATQPLTGYVTNFASPSDLATFTRLRQAGKSEKYALNYGDNGIGHDDLGTVGTTNAYGLALPHSYLQAQLGNDPAAYRTARVQATINGQTVTVPIVDYGPSTDQQNKKVITDATYPLSQALGGFDHAPVQMRIIPNAGPDYASNRAAWYQEQENIRQQLGAQPIGPGTVGFQQGGRVTPQQETAALQTAGQYAGTRDVLTPENAPSYGLDPNRGFIPAVPASPSVAPPSASPRPAVPSPLPEPTPERTPAKKDDSASYPGALLRGDTKQKDDSASYPGALPRKTEPEEQPVTPEVVGPSILGIPLFPQPPEITQSARAQQAQQAQPQLPEKGYEGAIPVEQPKQPSGPLDTSPQAPQPKPFNQPDISPQGPQPAVQQPSPAPKPYTPPDTSPKAPQPPGSTQPPDAQAILKQAESQLTPLELAGAQAYDNWDWNKGDPPAPWEAAYNKRAGIMQRLMTAAGGEPQAIAQSESRSSAATSTVPTEPGTTKGTTISGTHTIFGLNYDKTQDLQDNGRGFFTDNQGRNYDTRNPDVKVVAIPGDVLNATFGTFLLHHPDGSYTLIDSPEARKIYQEVESAHIEVADAQGKLHKFPIGDVQGALAGHPGKVLDFSYGAAKEMGYTDNGHIDYQIVKGDGTPYPVPDLSQLPAYAASGKHKESALSGQPMFSVATAGSAGSGQQAQPQIPSVSGGGAQAPAYVGRPEAASFGVGVFGGWGGGGGEQQQQQASPSQPSPGWRTTGVTDEGRAYTPADVAALTGGAAPQLSAPAKTLPFEVLPPEAPVGPRIAPSLRAGAAPIEIQATQVPAQGAGRPTAQMALQQQLLRLTAPQKPQQKPPPAAPAPAVSRPAPAAAAPVRAPGVAPGIPGGGPRTVGGITLGPPGAPGSTIGVPHPPGAEAITKWPRLKDQLAQHAAILSSDDPRVKKQDDGKIKGEHFVPGDPMHEQLIAGLPGGHQGRQRQILAEAEAAIADKRPMHISYISAPKEAARFPTRESRRIQYEAHSPEARLMGATEGQLVGHSFIPVSVGITPASKASEPHQGVIHGVSTNVLANNHHHLNTALATMGKHSPYPHLDEKFGRDLEGYVRNLNAGYRGTGEGPAPGTEEYPTQVDPSYKPHPLTRDETDFLNATINNQAAQAKTAESGKHLRELADRAGTLLTKEGETNALRHAIDMHHQALLPGHQKDWSDRVLEPTIRSFHAGLVHSTHHNVEDIQAGIRPGEGHQPVTEAMHRTSEMGRPDVALAANLYTGGLVTQPKIAALSDEEYNELAGNIRKQFLSGKLKTAEYLERMKDVPAPGAELHHFQGGGLVGQPSSGQPTFKEVSPQEFIAARNKSKRAEFLSELKPEHLGEHRLFLNEHGNVGAALDPKGDIQNVFNNSGGKGSGAHAIAHATENGGRTLDAFDGYLPHLYRQFGFRETGRMKFNDEFAPANWDYAQHGRPDVVFMGWNGYPEGGREAAIARAQGPKVNWIRNEPTSHHEEDYDRAKESSRAYARRVRDYRAPREEQGPQTHSGGGQVHSPSGPRDWGSVGGAPGPAEFMQGGGLAGDGDPGQSVLNQQPPGGPGVLPEEEQAQGPPPAPSMPSAPPPQEPAVGPAPQEPPAAGVVPPSKPKQKAPPAAPVEKPKDWKAAPEKHRQAYLEQKVANTLENQYKGKETHRLEVQRKEDGGIKYDPQGNPLYVKHDYDIANSPLLKKKGLNQIKDADEHEDTINPEQHTHLNQVERKRLSALRKASAVHTLGDKIVESYRSMENQPDVMAGKGWYSRMREKLANALGEHHELFAQLLGATSAKTPVRNNFIQALDALEQYKKGKFTRHIKKYLEGYGKMQEGKLALSHYMKKKGIQLLDKDGNPTDMHKTDGEAMAQWIAHHDILPLQKNGQKYNANSEAVLKVLAGTWLKEVDAPKTPNFAGNLTGRTLEATIDVWAARHLQRLGYQGLTKGKPWRAQAASEPGVNSLDFAFSQDAMRHAADKLGINPDDLQAILWFGEKHHHEKAGWTRGQGAEKSSFDDVADLAFPKSGKSMTSDELRKHYAAMQEAAKQRKARIKTAKGQLAKQDWPRLGPYVMEHELTPEEVYGAEPQEEEEAA